MIHGKIHNEKSAIVDVMNSKAQWHNRHSVKYNDFKEISKWYAVESRIYSGYWDDDLNKWVKNNSFFINELIFDLDFDESHHPDILDFKEALNNSLNKLENILGKPKFIITNKENYTTDQKEFYFKKDGKYNLPKSFGCQVIYNLTESIKSEYYERYSIYNDVRNIINDIIDGDKCFKGHMHKNPLNYHIFNIEKNDNSTFVDILEVAKRLGIQNAEERWNCKPFESYSCELNSVLNRYAKSIHNWYEDLNHYKFKNTNRQLTNYNLSDASRNTTLFNLFQSMSISEIKSCDYLATVSNPIFSLCAIKEPLSEKEFNTTKESVLNYLNKHHINKIRSGYSNVDTRVFKLNVKNYNETEAIKLNSLLNDIISKMPSPSIYDILEKIMSCQEANYLFESLENLWFEGNVKTLLNATRETQNITSLYELYLLEKNAIYSLHFKHLNDIKNKKHINIQSINKTDKKIKDLTKFGVYYDGNVIDFKQHYYYLKENDLLKDGVNPKPISFYQNYFHIRTKYASHLVYYIKQFVKYNNLKQIFDDIIKNRQNSSQNGLSLIKYYHILKFLRVYNYTYKKLFIMYQNILLDYMSKSDKNICNFCKFRSIMNKLNFYFDTETTGLNPNYSFILSLGSIIEYNNEIISDNYRVLNWYDIIPDFKLNDRAYKVNHLTEDYLKNNGVNPFDAMCGLYNDIMRSFEDYERDHIDKVIGFNLPYDVNMLRANLKFLIDYANENMIDRNVTAKIEDLLAIFSKNYYKYNLNKSLFIDAMSIDIIYKTGKHSLDAVGKKYGLQSDSNSHNALADAKRTYSVFKCQEKELNENEIVIDSDFEDKLILKYREMQKYWKSKNENNVFLDYFGVNAPTTMQI